MNVNGVSSAGMALVNREIQQSLRMASAAAAAQREGSIDAAARRAAAADIVRQQAANRAASPHIDAYL